MTRRRGNLDSNHPDIVKALRGIGASFLSLADLGEGKPDGLIGFRGRNRLVEIKDGKKPPSKRKPREKQEDFASTWNGEPVYLVQSIEDALEVATADVVPARLRLDPRPALERAARGAERALERVFWKGPRGGIHEGVVLAGPRAPRRRVMG